MEIVQLENQLAKSNCFLIVDRDSKSCVIIDPASRDSEKEIAYIEAHSLTLDYIILTHAHADHCWGVNSLRNAYPGLKLVYSEACNQKMKSELRLFFLFFNEDPDYTYEMKPAEIQIRDEVDSIEWHGHQIRLVLTPGHSPGSMCIEIDGRLFTGDTIMPYPPYFNGRGSNVEEWAASIKKIEKEYGPGTEVYPGHGEIMTLGEWSNSEYSRV